MNAIIKRCFYIKFRPGRIIPITCAYILLLLFILWTTWLSEYPKDIPRIFERWAHALLFIQYLLVFIGGLILPAHELYQERMQNTSIFFTSLPLTAKEKLKGMIIGGNLTNLLFLLITIPLTVISGLVGGIGLHNIIATHIILGPGMLFASLLGFLITLTSSKNYSPVTLVILFIIMGPFSTSFGQSNPFLFLSPITYYHLSFIDQEALTATSFFNVVCGAFIYLYFSYWLSIACLRKLEDEESSLLSLKQSVIFFFLTTFIFSGFMWESYADNNKEWGKTAFHQFNLFWAFLGLIIASSFVKGYKAYLAALGRPKRFNIGEHPCLLAIIFCGWLFFLSILSFWMPFKGLPFFHLFLYFLRLGLFLVFFITVMEFCAISQKGDGKGISWGVVIIVCIAPLILGGVSQSPELFASASPLEMVKIEDMGLGCVYAIAGLVISKILFWTRRKKLMEIRKGMQE